MRFTENSRLQRIGARCFQETKISTIALPSTVTDIGDEALGSAKIICAEDGLAGIRCKVHENQLIVTPHRDTLVLGQTLRELRGLKVVELPDGLEEVGSQWFAGSDTESVTVPASVRRISERAFLGSRLRKIEFKEGSALAMVGKECFRES